MKKIEEYIVLPLIERQAHLKLSEPCLDRGGHPTELSSYLKGLLAHILDTSIPNRIKVFVCHACHNGKCSNPYHIYWGTPRENQLDAMASGANKGISQYTKSKYTKEELFAIRSRAGKKGGSTIKTRFLRDSLVGKASD